MEETQNEINNNKNEDRFLFLPITSKETLELCLNYNSNINSILFLSSYPKSGTTWLQCIVYQLLSYGNELFEHISYISPFYEINKTWFDLNYYNKYHENHLKLGYDIFNTHLRWNMLPKGNNIKNIYIYRNGRDVVYSFFQHLSNQADSGTYNGTFEEFYNDWLNSNIPYGSWIKHLKTWIEAAQDPANNILLLRYEDLKLNLLQSIEKISNFLNCNYTIQQLEEVILPHCTFDYMKSHKHQYEPISVGWKPGFEFIRKGQIGDSDCIFNEHYRQLFDQMIVKEFPEGLPIWLQDYI